MSATQSLTVGSPLKIGKRDPLGKKTVGSKVLLSKCSLKHSNLCRSPILTLTRNSNEVLYFVGTSLDILLALKDLSHP